MDRECFPKRSLCSEQPTLIWNGQEKSDCSLRNKALRWQHVVLTPVCVCVCSKMDVCVCACVCLSRFVGECVFKGVCACVFKQVRVCVCSKRCVGVFEQVRVSLCSKTCVRMFRGFV